MKQIRLHITKAVAAAFLCAGLFACNEDKGNYNYAEIGTVTKIDSIEPVYIRVMQDSLVIRPKLAFNTELGPQTSEADFTYAWKIEQGSGDNGALKLLHEGRNLEIVIDTPIFQPEKQYTLLYEATNITTGIPYRSRFTVSIRNLYQAGYVALCQKTDGLELDIVYWYDNKFGLQANLLGTMGSELDRSATPWDIVTAEIGFAPNPLDVQSTYSVFILTDKYTTRILPKDYSWKESYDISNMVERNSYLDSNYVQKGKPIIAKQLRYSYMQSGSGAGAQMRGFLLMYHEEPSGEANWYLQKTYAQFMNFSVQMNRIRTANNLTTNGKERYKPAPLVATDRFSHLFYDMDQNCFALATLPPQNSPFGTINVYYSERVKGSENPGHPFMFTAETDSVLYMGEQEGAGRYSNKRYAIRKLSNGTIQYGHWAYPTTTTLTTYLTTAANTLSMHASAFPPGSQIEKAKFYARVPVNSSNWLYYVTTDNRVFKANVSGTTVVETEITDEIVKDGYSEITAFKFTRPESADMPLANALVVATYNGNPDTGGKMEFFVSDQFSGDLEVAKYPEPQEEGDEYQIMSFTGLGKVVGLTYKRQ
ncbi:MAG: hypothetical protein LBR65_09595 [Culturomica sp.]|nr:hypothetical protein [Culturomica sp.]